MPVKGALSQAVCSAASQEHQAWILRRFLSQVEGQEAADEEEPHSIVGEFAVSHLCCISFQIELPDTASKFIIASKLLVPENNPAQSEKNEVRSFTVVQFVLERCSVLPLCTG